MRLGYDKYEGKNIALWYHVYKSEGRSLKGDC